MNLGLLIIIILGIVLFLWGTIEMIKSLVNNDDSVFGIIMFFIYLILLTISIGFGLVKLFSWLFTIKLW